jgi:hypothetical protein
MDYLRKLHNRVYKMASMPALSLPGIGGCERKMIGIVHITVGDEIMDVDLRAKKLIVNPQKEKLTVVGKPKSISGFLKCIMEVIPNGKIGKAVGQFIQISAQYDFIFACIDMIHQAFYLDRSGHKAGAQPVSGVFVALGKFVCIYHILFVDTHRFQVRVVYTNGVLIDFHISKNGIQKTLISVINFACMHDGILAENCNTKFRF